VPPSGEALKVAGAGAPAEAGGERLPLSIKLAYGAPSFAGAALAIPILVHIPKFYSDVVLVPLSSIAIAIALARAFDAITDPLMGSLSDRTRTRWGRRRPWMALGVPLCALAVVALFMPPEGLGARQAALWFVATFMLYFFFHTIYVIPHSALGPELTLDYNERTSLFGWREGFTMVGLLVSVVAPGLLQDWAGMSPRATFALISIVFAGLLVILYGNLLVRVHERPDFMNRESNPIVPGVRRSLRNQPFRVLLIVYVVASIPGAIPATLMPYFTEYVIQPEKPQLWLSIYLAGYVGSGIACLPAWVWAARRWGKRRVWLASFWIGILGGPGIFLLGPGDLWAFLILITFVGAGFGAGQFLNPAIQADVMDYDELQTGKRREAQYSSFWAMASKFVAIPSAALPLALLGVLGYVPNQPQTPQVTLAISGLLGFAPALFSALSFFIALRFPITEESHRAIRDGVEAHRRGEVVTDPLTGRRLPPPADRGVPERTGWFLDHFSPGELRRVLRSGGRGLVGHTVLLVSVSLVVCVLSAWWALSQMLTSVGEPSAWVTGAVVGSGFALSAVGFHAIRVRAAVTLRREPLAAETIVAHLDSSGHGDPGGHLPVKPAPVATPD
jgi:GPH family glycoside/pentoside/hexuronide:cation symporter